MVESIDDFPFAVLAKETEIPLPLRRAHVVDESGVCRYCYDETIIKFGTEYCICQMIEYEKSLIERYRNIRTPIKKALLSELEVPKYYDQSEYNSIIDAMKCAEKFVRWPDKWLVLTGGVGVGKTHILRAINRSFWPLAIYIQSRSIETLVHKYRKLDELDTLIDALSEAPILLIDDLGMEYGGDLVKSILDGVIDFRYMDHVNYPTVVTTNQYANWLRQYLPRSGDRLTDKAISNTLAIDARSYRQRY